MLPLNLLQTLQQRPFIPFRLHDSDGGSYEVRHPDLVLVAASYAVIGVPTATNQPAMIERHDVLDLDHVTRLELMPSAAVTGNGQ